MARNGNPGRDAYDNDVVTDVERGPTVAFVLWIIAVVLAIAGVIQLLQGQIILGIVLLVAAALVGPGGYSIFGRSRSGV